MTYSIASNTIISDAKTGSFANVTIQNNGFLEVNSSDGFQGTVAGYTSGGNYSNKNLSSLIDKFPFSSDTNATDVGDLVVDQSTTAGQSSTTHGYNSGGFNSPPFSGVNTIQKFPFAVDTNSVDIGDLIEARAQGAGQSSTVSGYTSGGGGNNVPSPLVSNTIDKFPFATDTNATNVGDSTQNRRTAVGQTSTTHGYTTGGVIPPGTTNVIDKFPFSTDTNASDVGDLTQARGRLAGQSSTTHGYASGGVIPPANPIIQVNTIEKFPFSSDTNATDIGDLTQSRTHPSSQGPCSTTSGYTTGGYTSPPSSANLTNVIDKFPFSTDTNATDVGDLTASRMTASGQQD